jgi:hypothetical protein
MPDPITIQQVDVEAALRRQLERGESASGTFGLTPGARYGLFLARIDSDADIADIAMQLSLSDGVVAGFPVGDHTAVAQIPDDMELTATVKVRVRGRTVEVPPVIEPDEA